VSLVHQFQTTLTRLCGGAVRIVVGVSGGADSVALLHLAIAAGARERVIAAHLNHRLRGREADEDAEWVSALCAKLAVPLARQSVDVAARAAAVGTGIEESARAARYAFFEETARQHGAGCVAVAHTADDQAETVLHHVLRGTGLAGLAGMPETRPLNSTLVLVRPLLSLSRAELRAYLASIGQDFREDASNASLDYTRNRLRAELPRLAQEFNPRIVERLVSLGSLARDAQDALAHRARQLLELCLREPRLSRVEIHVTPLRGEPRHLVREMFVELWKARGWPRQPMSARHWDGLAAVALGEAVALSLPGAGEARRSRGVVTIHVPDA
jgi:tRNA(Ile)-lysidine synthase